MVLGNAVESASRSRLSVIRLALVATLYALAATLLGAASSIQAAATAGGSEGMSSQRAWAVLTLRSRPLASRSGPASCPRQSDFPATWGDFGAGGAPLPGVEGVGLTRRPHAAAPLRRTAAVPGYRQEGVFQAPGVFFPMKMVLLEVVETVLQVEALMSGAAKSDARDVLRRHSSFRSTSP